jgi:hypothetical protein
MPIEYEVSSLDGVEEALRGAYVEEDGKFKLDVDKYAELKSAPLLAKNKQLLDEKKKAEQSLKATQPDKERIADLEREVKHYKLTVPIRDLALKSGMIAERLDLALLDLQKRFSLDESGQLQTLDEFGNPMPGMTPEKFFKEVYLEQRPYLFHPKGGFGSGAPQLRGGASGGSLKTLTRAAFEALSPEQKVTFSKGGGTLTD